MLDLEQLFDSFTGKSGGSVITEVYNMIPTLSQKQQKILLQLKMFATRYELDELHDFILLFNQTQSKNKNLNFMKSMNMKQLLRAYTQEELIKGVKPTIQHSTED